MKKYPKVLYAQIISLGTQDEYICACERFEDLENDGEAGVYELKRMAKRETKVSINLK